MPSIIVHPPSKTAHTSSAHNRMPHLLRTPSGLAILELQGKIHVPSLFPAEDDNNTTNSTTSTSHQTSTAVGKLVFPNYSPSNPADDTKWMKTVYLYVGKHQRLTGEVQKLSKPLGLLRRRDGGLQEGERESGTRDKELEIAEIVRYKIVFSQRPEPVGDE